jgi:hypothetical protein
VSTTCLDLCLCRLHVWIVVCCVDYMFGFLLFFDHVWFVAPDAQGLLYFSFRSARPTLAVAMVETSATATGGASTRKRCGGDSSGKGYKQRAAGFPAFRQVSYNPPGSVLHREPRLRDLQGIDFPDVIALKDGSCSKRQATHQASPIAGAKSIL